MVQTNVNTSCLTKVSIIPFYYLNITNEYMNTSINRITKIVVLVPIKNEDWILDKFLAITEKFADSILIADQFSTDRSVEIASKYDKVILIRNESQTYDEAYRQRLLIAKSRELFSGRNFLLALDADELLTADSLLSKFWIDIDHIKPGTVITFEKPDILSPMSNCIRYSDGFKLGYLDDGREHKGKLIHSPRIPFDESSPILNISDVKFMHYARVRSLEYYDRQRLYSMIENVRGVNPFYKRLNGYSPKISSMNNISKIEISEESWFDGWEKMGIEIRKIPSCINNIYANQICELLAKYGSIKFSLDDIWDRDWKKFNIQYFSTMDRDISNISILRKLLLDVIIYLLKSYKLIRRLVK